MRSSLMRAAQKENTTPAPAELVRRALAETVRELTGATSPAIGG
jgi:hypothetical protein